MARINSTFKARYIRPENICIGDTIRWTESYRDVQRSVVGVVARKEYDGEGTRYISPEHIVIGLARRDGLTKPHITLLQPAPQNRLTQLETFDTLMEEAKNRT